MAIKVGEVGKKFRYATGFVMSSSTGLTLNFTKPNGTDTLQKTEVTVNAVTAPAVAVTDDDLGLLAASTYMEFDTVAADFDIDGTWRVCGIYNDATPKEFHGDETTFVVGKACS